MAWTFFYRRQQGRKRSEELQRMAVQQNDSVHRL